MNGAAGNGPVFSASRTNTGASSAIDTGYNSTEFDWGRVPVIQKSKLIRTSVKFKPKCTLPPDLMTWIESTVNPDGDNRGLILLSHHGSHSSFGEWYRFLRGSWRA